VKKATGAADLSELTAVVTGTAQGIGRAIAASIRHAGADVFEVDKDTVDLTDSTAVREFFASLPAGDILVKGGLHLVTPRWCVLGGRLTAPRVFGVAPPISRVHDHASRVPK